MTTMKAVQIHAYGDPEVLSYEETARPEPKPNEVLIQQLLRVNKPWSKSWVQMRW